MREVAFAWIIGAFCFTVAGFSFGWQCGLLAIGVSLWSLIYFAKQWE